MLSALAIIRNNFDIKDKASFNAYRENKPYFLLAIDSPITDSFKLIIIVNRDIMAFD